jgi:DNA helicase HerA-like ATPase
MGLFDRLRSKKADGKDDDTKDTPPEPVKKQDTRPRPDPLVVSRPQAVKKEAPAPRPAPRPAPPEKKAAPAKEAPAEKKAAPAPVKKEVPAPKPAPRPAPAVKEAPAPKPVSNFVPQPEKRAEPPPERRVIPQPERRAEPPRPEPPPPEKKHVPKPIPPYKGPVTKPPVAETGSIEDKTEEVGIIYGNVGTSAFSCRVTAHMEKSEYIMAEHEDCGPVLCQVGSLIRKTDLTVEKTLNMDGNTDIQEKIIAEVNVVGYRDDRGLLQIPRTTFSAGKPVYKANDALIQSVLGLKMKEKTGAYIGLLHGHGVPVYLNINDLLQRHACILAKTGGGKSYMSGDIIEELMKHNVTCMIIDPHGEYSAMRDIGKPGDKRFGVAPRSYAEHIKEFTISKNAGELSTPLRFTLKTLEAREVLELTRTNDIRSHLPSLRKAIDSLRERQDAYSVRELIDVLSRDEDSKNPALIGELEYLDEIGIFATRGNRVDELIEEGRTTIINLKGVPPDIQELIVRRLGTLMFDMRKLGSVPPMMMIIEEAHNYCPQQGTAISSRTLATIASEGRKFGLGLMVISQRPAKIDKNVLSQCGTQIILKVTNPNDVKAIASSVEGLTNGMTEDIQTMPIGIAMVVGAGIEAPLLVDVRPRESRHGGAGVKVLSEDD